MEKFYKQLKKLLILIINKKFYKQLKKHINTNNY